MTTKIKPGEPLWTTDNLPVSGAKMLYGVEIEDEIKEKYNMENLNERADIPEETTAIRPIKQEHLQNT